MEPRPHLWAVTILALALTTGDCTQSTTASVAPMAASPTYAGLASTPPMGFNGWNAFGCGVDARLIEQTADALVESGMRAAGYRSVNLDDCWMAPARDASGSLQADRTRFPHGIAALASYMHARGLQLGIYEDAGAHTCAWALRLAVEPLVRLPGSYGHENHDARTFASWGVDYLKYDWCDVPYGDFPGATHQTVAKILYKRMRDALRATGRPIVFSMCNGWDPSVQPQTWARSVSDLWRTTQDISDSYGSMVAIFHRNVGLGDASGPYGWNDPDMMEVGNGGMTIEEYRTHMTLWVILAAPLLVGNDPRTMTNDIKEILLNREVLAVDQDTLGKQGRRLIRNGAAEIWAKPLSEGAVAVALFNRGASLARISVRWSELGLNGRYKARDLWNGADLPDATNSYSAEVPSHGSVLLRITK